MGGRIAIETQNTAFSSGKMFCNEFDNWRIIYGTLWADGGATEEEQLLVSRCINDFRVIKKNGGNFKVTDMIDIHNRQKQDLQMYLQKPFEGKTIVMSHHLPSYKLCHPRFSPEMNGGFASNCDDLLKSNHAPDIWVFGHTHDTCEVRLWNTLAVSNPGGYRSETGSGAFNQFSPKFITLDNVKD